MSEPTITLFADFTCPFSYVTEAALRRRGGVRVRARAFELYPAPAPLPAPDGAWEDALRPLAEEAGVELRVPAFRTRTRKAHEAVVFAAQRGVEEALRATIYAAYWRDGRDIGRIDVLTALIAPLGIDPAELKIALDIDQHEQAVLRDEALAERLNVTGTPTLFVGSGPGASILVGAQSTASLDEAIERQL